mmetsp:Transcript_9797/g.30235  ORF Transcript_9797/g.30235 Transcript_9797/m.30235 type:complete len:288 (-) Transcript_9797:67-930(-)
MPHLCGWATAMKRPAPGPCPTYAAGVAGRRGAPTKRPPNGMLLSHAEADLATAALAGRELPGDLVQQVSSITMGQLFFILGHIQKLSAQAPVTAQALLAQNPQICHALLHAECLAGMTEEPALPMTGEELKRAKAKARRIQEDLESHELPPPAGGPPPPAAVNQATAAPPQSATTGAMLSAAVSKFANKAASPAGHPTFFPVFAKSQAARLPGAPPFGGAPQPPPPRAPMPASALFGAAAAADLGSEEDKQHLLDKVMQLTPEQIGKLPEETKVQLLTFLQQHSSQP